MHMMSLCYRPIAFTLSLTILILHPNLVTLHLILYQFEYFDHLQFFFFFFLMIRRPPKSPLFPYTPPFRSGIRLDPRRGGVGPYEAGRDPADAPVRGGGRPPE